MSHPRQITLILEGPPTPRREPEAFTLRGGAGPRVRMHPAAATVARMRLWSDVWRDEGRPGIEGPVSLEILISVERPKSHLLRDGTLSATGRRRSMPRVDCSNVAKLIEDALKHRAFGDDDLIGELWVRKGYGPRSETRVVIRELHGDD